MGALYKDKMEKKCQGGAKAYKYSTECFFVGGAPPLKCVLVSIDSTHMPENKS